MRVLIADDNRLERTILRTTVVRLGHLSAEAADGDAAWGAFCDFMPDVIISNWVLPGLTGPEFCRRVRATPQGRRLYFMLQTIRRSVRMWSRRFRPEWMRTWPSR